MMFDPSRPCGGKTRSKNRYSRDELNMLAKSLHIKGRSTMDMDALCAAVKKKSPLPPLVATTPTSPVTPSKSLCLLDPNRPCGKHTGKKKNRYTLPELKALWKKECKDLPEFKGRKPGTLADYCHLLKQRYTDIKFIAVKKLPENTVKTIKTWLSKVYSRPVPQQETLFLESESYDVVLKNVVSTLEIFSSGKVTGTIKRHFELRRQALAGSDFSIFKAKTDPHYIYNPNVGSHFPRQWLKEQKEYIFGLPWMNKIRVLCYSYAGDKICNSFLLGTFSAKNVVEKDFRTNYTRHLFPLALDIFLHTRRFATFEKWLAFFGYENHLYVETTWEHFFTVMKTFTFENAYGTILDFVERETVYITDKMWYTWAGEYALHLNAIIADAPPVPSPGIYTFRGVDDASYITANKNNVFLNETFMSTSLDMGVGLKFMNSFTNCCLFTLQVLPGSRCLFVGALSYYPQEMEVLFAPGRQLFVTKTQFKASNPKSDVLVTRFSLMN